MLELLDDPVVVDKLGAQASAQHRVLSQRLKCLAELPRNARRMLGALRVRRFGGRRRQRASGDAIEPSVYLRRQVQVRVGRRLTEPVFNAGGPVAWPTHHPEHGAPVVTAPND